MAICFQEGVAYGRRSSKHNGAGCGVHARATFLVNYDTKTFLAPQTTLLIDTEGANILRSLWADILNQKLIPVRSFWARVL